MFSPTKLKRKRESQGLSQSQLASSLGIVEPHTLIGNQVKQSLIKTI